jgi:spermidine/putrescine-binding protein
MSIKPTALFAASLLLLALLATPASAAAPLPRKLLRLQGAANPEQQIAAMAQFREAEGALLKKVSSGDAGKQHILQLSASARMQQSLSALLSSTFALS